MIVAAPGRVPIAFMGLGQADALDADVAAVLREAAKLHADARDVGARAFVTDEQRRVLEGIKERAFLVQGEATQPAAQRPPVAEMALRLSVARRNLEDVERDVRRNILLLSFGTVLGMGVAGWYVWKKA